MAKKYLEKVNYHVFGICYNFSTHELALGSENLTLIGDDIIITKTNEKYDGTPGLWLLLTSAGPYGSEEETLSDVMKSGHFTDKDYNAYSDILIKTNAMHHGNDPTNMRPKASKSWKWKQIVYWIWNDYKSKQGFGLKVYNKNPIEYKYIGDYNELLDRLAYMEYGLRPRGLGCSLRSQWANSLRLIASRPSACDAGLLAMLAVGHLASLDCTSANGFGDRAARFARSGQTRFARLDLGPSQPVGPLYQICSKSNLPFGLQLGLHTFPML